MLGVLMALSLSGYAAIPLELGHWVEDFALPSEGSPAVYSLSVAVVEPLTVIVDSWDASLSLEVRDESGIALAQRTAQDIGDFFLHWTPPKAGEYEIHVLGSGSPRGFGNLVVLRSRLDLTVPDPAARVKFHWQVALARAALREDGERCEYALSKLASVERRDELRERRSDLHRRVQIATESLSIPDGTEAHVARARVRQVLSAIEGWGHSEPDAVVAYLRFELGRTAAGLNDAVTAIRAWEPIIRTAERGTPRDHPDLDWFRHILAIELFNAGRFAEACRLMHDVVNYRGRVYPADHGDLLRARGHLGHMLAGLGDYSSSILLLEQALDGMLKKPGTSIDDIRHLKLSVATARRRLGMFAGAKALHEEILASYHEDLGTSPLNLVENYIGLCESYLKLGEARAARELLETLLEEWAAQFPRGHVSIESARQALVDAYWHLEEYALALKTSSETLARRLEVFPPGNPEVSWARRRHIALLSKHGDIAARDMELEKLIDSELQRLDGSSLLGWNEARAIALQANASIGAAMTFGDDARFGPGVFELVETCRAVSTTSPLVDGETEENRRLREEYVESRLQVGNCVAARNLGSSEANAAELVKAVTNRARLESKLVAAGRGGAIRVATHRVAASLPQDTIAVGYWSYTPTRLPNQEENGAQLVAFVVKPNGFFRCLRLGPEAAVGSLVAEYRSAMGVSGRGFAIDSKEGRRGKARVEEQGRRLVERVLEPVLRLIEPTSPEDGRTRKCVVCVRGVLHLINLDTLPLGEGLVGDRLQIEILPSFRSLIEPPTESGSGRGSPGTPGLLLVGGIDYDAEGDLGPVDPRVAAAPSDLDRGEDLVAFSDLPETRLEVDTVGVLYEAQFDKAPTVLRGVEATKAALLRELSKSSHFHFASHGYFAPDQLREWSTDDMATWSTLRPHELVERLAPLSLCGLALTGANRGVDIGGRVAGILTAEELAGHDLSKCEVAVLSACQTHLGISKPGMGPQSLQAALNIAGVRQTLTSLWRVGDNSARRFMEEFYKRLWQENQDVPTALWNTRLALRKEGRAAREWAGWVLVRRWQSPSEGARR